MAQANLSFWDLAGRLGKLQTVSKLRAMIRKMWGLDVEFVDANGVVLDRGRGRVHTVAGNPFCDKCLLDREGMKKCDKSVRETLQEIRRTGRSAGAVYDHCHAGFRYLAVPVIFDERLVGAVMTAAFLTEKPTAETEKRIRERTAAFRGREIPDERAALSEIPVLAEAQVTALEQVISFGIDEVVRYHAEEQKRAAATVEVEPIPGHKAGGKLIVGASPAMKNLFLMLDKLSDSDSTVLVQGDNGTGKELVAKAIHFHSLRRDRPFVTQNCSALNDNLLDSELFGHVKGSFTGAIRDKKGLFEVADGGTFFMDEVADMSPMLQVKLLRVLQEGMFVPVGGTEPRYVDVRIVAATNKDLRRLVDQAQFREDLYYRLNVITITVPSLRDRREDIPVLVTHFLDKYAKSALGIRKTVTPEAMDALMAYNWPGNVRQLENEMQRAIVLSGRSQLIDREVLSPVVTTATASAVQVRMAGKLRDMMEHVERQILLEGLRRHNWNKSRLSRELGVSRATLIWKVGKYGIVRDART